MSLRVGQDKYVRYRCDHYPDVVRITDEDGTQYARTKGKPWLRSKDWGETGTGVEEAKARKLDTEVAVTESPFEKFAPGDPSQGGLVWRLVDTRKEGDLTYFTYEESRERPHPDGVYPRFTFVKYKGDKDGQLLLSFYTSQMHALPHIPSEHPLVPVEIKCDYMVPLPADTKVEVIPAKPRKAGGG